MATAAIIPRRWCCGKRSSGTLPTGRRFIFDQFIAAGEEKWGLLSGLVVLLPHGYEGQGPEHSSARVERFIQLAARDNMQICQPTTAAQYFHLLRRQALRRWRKPLVVFTPKGMLRHPAATSPARDFTVGRFLPLIPDSEAINPTRVLLATGKVVHDLRAERKKLGDTATAIFALDQIFPFPERELLKALRQYDTVREVVWVQEEPTNMGALTFVMPRLRRLAPPRSVRSVKLSASPSPATGSGKDTRCNKRRCSHSPSRRRKRYNSLSVIDARLTCESRAQPQALDNRRCQRLGGKHSPSCPASYRFL